MIAGLSNSELLTRFEKCVRTERKVTHLILECVAEIDRRKLYLDRAYPSLFEMLVRGFGYSPTAALRRIDAARLLRDVPAVAEKVESGALNLSQLAQVQQSLKQARRAGKTAVTSEQKTQLLKKIENMSHQVTQVMIAREMGLEPIQVQQQKTHADESVTMTLTFTKEQMQVLSTARERASNALTDLGWSEVITHLAAQFVREKTVVKRRSKVDELRTEVVGAEVGASTNGKEAKRKSLRPNLRKDLLREGACCEFRDSRTGRTCGSRYFLQIDHVQPIWAGGQNATDNLRVLCGAHNRRIYQRQSGVGLLSSPNRR